MRAPHPHRDHSEDVVQSGNGMQEAAGKANGLAATLMSENSERVEQKAENQERAAARSNRLNEVFHSGWLDGWKRFTV